MTKDANRNEESTPGPVKNAGRRLSGIAGYVGRMAAVPEIKETHRKIKSWWQIAFASAKPMVVVQDVPDYQAEMRRLGYSPDHMRKRQRELLIEAWFYLIAVAAIIGWSLTQMMAAQSLLPFLFAVLTPCAAGPLVVLAARASFRHWQIENQRLGGWHDWLRRPQDWLPL